MQMIGGAPLGKKSAYPRNYSPELLVPIAREESRSLLGLGSDLPFRGEDIWNAYELSWLDDQGKPRVATAEFRVPAETPNIVESKSMKLYLNSYSMSRYGQADDVARSIADDLSRAAGGPVGVRLTALAEAAGLAGLPGECIDELDVECGDEAVDAGLLGDAGDEEVSEELHSHLLRSSCPVTNQPDSGSILIRYTGKALDRAGLLRYLVAYRNHQAFHESCVERIFVDIKAYCEPRQLTVYARYNRRGGIDINPFRSDFEATIENVRLTRQ